MALFACGGSDSEPEAVEPQIGTVELVASREGNATVLSGGGPVEPRVVIPDDILPDGVTKDDLTGSVVYASDPETGVTAVEFLMGPDGTEFSAPIDLSWIGHSGEGVTTAIMAVDDEGNNLLTQNEADAIVSTLSSGDVDGEGVGQVSMSIDHFSSWYIYQYNSTISATSVGDEYINAGVGLAFDYWVKDTGKPSGYFSLNTSYWLSHGGITRNPCIDAVISVSGGAGLNTTQGESCGTSKEETRRVIVTCPNSNTIGEITVDFSAYFGVSGFAPMEKLMLLFASTQRTGENYSKNESAFIASSDLAIFVSGRLTKAYDCSDGISATTTVASLTTPAPSTAPSTSTVGSSGPSTSTPRSTVMTAPSGIPTTRGVNTTVTSVPRPNGGTTTSTTARPVTVPSGSSTTLDPYSSVPTTPVPAEPEGTWLRNDPLCRWRGTSTCGIYSSGNAMYSEPGPSGGPGQTYFPIGGTPGVLAFNLLSGNTIENCDWNGSGGCGYYYTGTPGNYTINAMG